VSSGALAVTKPPSTAYFPSTNSQLPSNGLAIEKEENANKLTTKHFIFNTVLIKEKSPVYLFIFH
jgi:hypothetical protein